MNEEAHLISIIVPTRNRYNFVRLLIGDILKQDISNYEIIVVDQSDSFEELEDCIHIKSNTIGPCISRNIGAKNAKGDVLVFLDDDARINSDFLREITMPIISGKFTAVAGSMCDPDGNYLLNDDDFLRQKNDNFIKVFTNNPDSLNSRICISFPGCCSAIKSLVFRKINGFDESFDPTGAGEDRDMALNLYKHGYSIWYNAKAKLMHTVAETGGTRDVGSRSIMIDIHSYRICKKYFSKELTESIKYLILKKYRRKFHKSILSGSYVRTKYRNFQTVKKLLHNR